MQQLLWRKSSIYWFYVFVALGIEHALGTGHIVMCGLHRTNLFFQINSQKKAHFKNNYGTQNLF